MSIKILLVEDDPSQRKMMSMLLIKKLKFSVIEAENGRDALDILQQDTKHTIQLILMDVKMPKMDGLEALGIISQQYPHLPVIMMTGTTDVDNAVKSMKLGAYDYLEKMPEPERLKICIQNALKRSLLEKEVSRLKRKDEGVFTFDNMIGHDSGLANSVKTGRKAASADIPVLLTGETGVGKEVFARAIHGESHRTGNNFVAVNCGAIPEQLVESTLFGHEKGAFTGAIAKAIGRFREADGGTIFLDEIGELPLEAQVKLLRVLQQKEIQPVGAASTLPVNVRIISATNLNLEKEVAEGRFREDLYFRINVLPIDLPSLRDRREDIPDLVHHFIERFAASEGRPLKDISEEALEMLSGWQWAGNIRELENTIHRAMILSENDVFDVHDFSELPALETSSVNDLEASDATPANHFSFLGSDGRLRTLDDIENKAIQFSLTYHKNNITRAANDLGMTRATFYRKVKRIKEECDT